MSYRIDADIQFPYGRIIDLSSREQISPNINIKWEEPDDNFQG
jgi:hypothetical protein